MRLIGLLVTLAALGYAMHVYLGSSKVDVQTKPAEYIDQANQSVDAINDAMKKQQEQMEKATK
jgi:hypothetical protein